MIDLHLDVDINTLSEKDAKQKIDDINQVALHFDSIGYFEECKYCADNVLVMAEEINYQYGIARAQFTLALRSYHLADYETAIQLLISAAKIFKVLGSHGDEASVYSYLGICYRYIDDYSAMIDTFFKSLHIYREIGDEKGEGNVLNSIGNYYLEVRQEELALEYYAMTLKIKRKYLDVEGCIMALYNKGLIYNNIGENEKALKYYSEALNFNEKIEQNPFYKYRIKQNIASVYRSSGNYAEAEEILLQCIEYFAKINNAHDKCDTMQTLGILYSAMGKFELAEKTLKDAETLAKKLNSKRLQMLTYEGMTSHYLLLNDYKHALFYRRKHIELNMERNKTAEDDKVRKLNILHKVDITKKETEILSLKNEELVSLNDDLVSLNNGKNYFMNLAANDLKIPLEKITYLTGSIKNKNFNIETKVKMLDKILNHSSSMQNIIQDLLNVNEAETLKNSD